MNNKIKCALYNVDCCKARVCLLWAETKIHNWYLPDVNDDASTLRTVVGVWVGSCNAIFSHVLGMKRSLFVVSEIVKFWLKEPSHEHRPGAVEWGQWKSRFAQKTHNGWRNMSIKLWRQSRITPMVLAKRAKTEKNTASSVRCEIACFD